MPAMANMNISGATIHLHVSPMFHVAGGARLFSVTVAGGTHAVIPTFEPSLFLGALERFRVTLTVVVPTMLNRLVNHPGLGDYDLSCLDMLSYGASPMPGALLERAMALFPDVRFLQSYGMTELSPASHVDFMDAQRNRPGSVGQLTADTEHKIVDLETSETEVAPGEPGELLVRGPQVMKGYFNNPQATAETITPDGWLHTGDIVRADDDDYIWVLDRKKELIKYKGFQVPPAELEGLLLGHPAVADAAVIGVQDEESGEVPKAFVVAKEGHSPSAEEIMEYIAGQVATFKQIRRVQFVDAIPKNPSGKILRRVLIEQERGAPVE